MVCGGSVVVCGGGVLWSVVVGCCGLWGSDVVVCGGSVL